MNTLENQIVLVTGSNRGIGRGIIEELLNRNVSKVYACARNTESLTQLAQDNGGKISLITLDVTDEAQVAAAAAEASDVTLLINNAGLLAGGDIITGDLCAARKEFEVNYWGPQLMTRAFAPILKANGGGGIINLSSVAGLSNFPALPTYSDSKAAIHSFTSACRLLLAEQGTFVAGVYPGPVDTDMAKGIEMEKESVSVVAGKILDGFVNKVEDIFPDDFAAGYAEPYAAGHKALENNIAAMLQEG